MDIKKIVCRTMALAGCMVGAVFAGDISVAQKQDTVVFSAAGRPLIEYRSDPAAYKPYVLQMYSPAGAAVLRDV